MRYLIFGLAGEEFGFPVGSVKEILRMQEITAVPKTASCLRGVMNLRGKIIPVMDLRVRFGFAGVDGENTCIVVAQNADLQIGIVVDRVCEVLNSDVNLPEGSARRFLEIEEVLASIVN